MWGPHSPTWWVRSHCLGAASFWQLPSRRGRAREEPPGGCGDSTAWREGQGGSTGLAPTHRQEGAGSWAETTMDPSLPPTPTQSRGHGLVRSRRPPGSAPRTAGQGRQLAHHQVAPELVIDDGRQQVHQKQAPWGRQKPQSGGTPGPWGLHARGQSLEGAAASGAESGGPEGGQGHSEKGRGLGRATWLPAGHGGWGHPWSQGPGKPR